MKIKVGSSGGVSTQGTVRPSGTYAGEFNPASGLPTTGTGRNGAILKGDFWQATGAGTIAGLEPFTIFAAGDLIYADKNNAQGAGDFFGNKGTGGGGSMVYPGAGIALSTGSAWGTSITDNSANWNTAFGWGDHSGVGYFKSGANTLTETTGFYGSGTESFLIADVGPIYIQSSGDGGGNFISFDAQPSPYGNVARGLGELNNRKSYFQYFYGNAAIGEVYESSYFFGTNGAGDVGLIQHFKRNDGASGTSVQVNAGSGSDTETAIDGFHVYTSNSNYNVTASDLKFRIRKTGEVQLNLGSDATGDTYYRNSSGYFTRLPVGTNGHVLTLAAGLPSWAAAAGGASLSGLTAATGPNTINNADNAQEWQWNTLGAGTGLTLSSSSTAAASNTQTVLSVTQTGANATSTQTTYAGYFSNTKTGTANINVGLYAEASGAAAGSNFALWSKGGGILETTTTGNLNIRSSSGADWWIFDNTRLIYLMAPGGADRITPKSGGLSFLASLATAIDHYTFTGNNALTATSGTARLMVLSKGITLSSGTTTYKGLEITGTYNVTGGTNTAIGFDYNPTITSFSAGTHYAIRATSGRVLLAGLPTASAGLATGELWSNGGVINIV